jgi:DNA polymerase III delta prime subunit
MNYVNKLWNLFYIHFLDYLKDLSFYNYIIDQVSNFDIQTSPNILFYGAKGFPHSLLIETAICKKFNLKFPIQKRFPKWKDLFSYAETDYYFELDCFHPEFTTDLNVLIEFLLTISKHKCIHIARHIIVMKNIEFFHNNNSQSLRVIFERFYNNVLFICTTNHINKIELPIQSRMQLIRIPLPKECEQRHLLEKLTKSTKYVYVDRNFVRNLFFTEHKLNHVLNYPPIIDFIKQDQSKEEIRKFSLKLFQQSISTQYVIVDLLTFMKDSNKIDFLYETSKLDHESNYLDHSKVSFYIELILHLFFDKFRSDIKETM